MAIIFICIHPIFSTWKFFVILEILISLFILLLCIIFRSIETHLSQSFTSIENALKWRKPVLWRIFKNIFFWHGTTFGPWSFLKICLFQGTICNQLFRLVSQQNSSDLWRDIIHTNVNDLKYNTPLAVGAFFPTFLA